MSLRLTSTNETHARPLQPNTSVLGYATDIDVISERRYSRLNSICTSADPGLGSGIDVVNV